MSKLSIALISITAFLVLFLITSFVAKLLFNNSAEKEVEAPFEKVENKGEIVTKENIEGLPKNVQRWLEYSGVIGKEKITTVRLKQKAEMRLDKDKSWMPVQAEQYFTSEKPAFIELKREDSFLKHVSVRWEMNRFFFLKLKSKPQDKRQFVLV
ncbi:hypothetical protein GCM10011351_30620 [Paraliobacillus quinghaiensis]|uniref:Uncharacterized protein n=1 Tax=Paraliobacillus quinghaiensis TaxID=470815 RepID=A0A917WYR3_9BACI|nr:DUF6544 family protein [Paraliobacillus quinghaiensis]GGM42507.1 hypothetical protein GCM10011351_30620 [Paraliobacillus quinghaiensis]